MNGQAKSADLAPGKPFVAVFAGKESGTTVCLEDSAGGEMLRYEAEPHNGDDVPPPATEPSLPEKVTSSDQLYFIGLGRP